MIRKLFLLFCLVGSLFSQESFLSFKYGLTSVNNDDGVDFSNNSFALDYTLDNGYELFPRVGLAYVDIDASGESVSGLLQFSLEGLYDIEIQSILTPYLFAGCGYENVMNSRKNFDSQFFVDGGLGLRYSVNDRLSLLSEFKSLYMLGGSDQDAEFAWYIGLSMPLDYTKSSPKDSDGDGIFDYADLCPNTPYGVNVDASGCLLKSKVIAQVDSDRDTVADDIDRCPNTPLGVGVDIYGCPVVATYEEPEIINKVITKKKKINKVKDSDGDGIEDRLDRCPNTLKGFSVNSSGCPIKKTLEVRFDPNSYEVTFESKPKIAEFADFIRRYPNAKIEIIGYTDTSGDRRSNKLLSLKRARSVKSLLVQYGIKKTNIKAVGKGDLNPIATNDTPEGREKNRRIEVVIK